MRHNKKFNHLGRQASHRKAMLANMASSLVKHKRISTTLAKAKALRIYFEPLVTKAKQDTTHSRRIVFSYLRDKEATAELFRTVAPAVGERPGGYTRILKTGFRQGDAAEMCLIELVDFNEAYTKGTPAAKSKTRRSRSGSGAAKPAAAQVEGGEVAAEGAESAKPAVKAAPKAPAKKPAAPKPAARQTAPKVSGAKKVAMKSTTTKKG